ncbi:hybrid sensor histidine kinase/response regulator [Chelativorans sp. M5D2P16]|uniref:hybrid sensor histidine kinase/response regulator n=1 Tax=Chelativorans sp. M5D2P16 TaxID=3095678 RepID=UPI002ACA45E5|nr:response regulator [Chelativorans sp. M5D2P16]MDZ5696195.1 response regulator [Chelativorans sp. M5D2P16]
MNMAKGQIDRQLLELFTREMQERAREFEHLLLSLEGLQEAQVRRSVTERLLRIAHSLKGAAGLVEVRPVELICHKMEDMLTLHMGSERAVQKEDLDALLAAVDAISETAMRLDGGAGIDAAPIESALRKVDARLKERPRDDVGEDKVEQGPTDEDEDEDKTGQTGPAYAPRIRSTDLDGSMRISGERLDTLLYRSGELVAAKSRLASKAAGVASLRERLRRLRSSRQARMDTPVSLEHDLRELASGLAEDARLIGSLVDALDHEIRRARMQRLSEACQGLPRLVRDLGVASGKMAELHLMGGEIEIDRSLAAGLQDCLRHLVRNAMGHGIETPEARRAAGKPEKGRISISAALFGDRFQVHVEDDGRGFDVTSVMAAARKLGFPEPVDERQRLRQALEPGVSTSAELTKLSGRGVGLDIVRDTVEALRGSVEVSNASSGGAAFTLTLPLTLATVRALEVSVGGQIFAFDTASIRRVGRVRTSELPAAGQRGVLAAESGEVRILDLATWLQLPGTGATEVPDHCQVVFVGPSGGEMAIIVDRILGEEELLVRPLGPRLANLRHYSGATILADGRIALLLNPPGLLEAVASEERFGTDAYVSHPPPVRKILVVDDSPSVRMLEKLILEAAGYTVILAEDGSEAWKYLQEQGADVVVADVDMPGMDGLALTGVIRRSRKFARLPVVLVTGRDTAEEKAQGLQVGADAYIAKSGFDQQSFLETVRQMI